MSLYKIGRLHRYELLSRYMAKILKGKFLFKKYGFKVPYFAQYVSRKWLCFKGFTVTCLSLLTVDLTRTNYIFLHLTLTHNTFRNISREALLNFFFFPFQQNNLPSNNNMSKAAKNVIKTMLTISIVFVLCWTPNTIYFILYTARTDIPLSGLLFSFTAYAVFGNAIVNPFIYSLQYAPFQNQTKKLFCRNNREGDSVATTSSIS